MFAKLLKHEFKSCAGLMGLLSLASLGVGVGGGLIMRYMVQTPEWIMDDALGALLMLLFVFAFLSLFAFSLSGWIYLCVQFYKRKFTDQGYLTFTLPVPVWQIYLSSFLNFLLWSVILGTAVVVSFVGIFLIGFINTEVWDQLVIEFRSFPFQEMFVEFDLINPLYSIVQAVSSVLIIMNCITLGSVLAKKHKVLGAIVSYYAVSMLMGAVSTWLMNMMYISDTFAALNRLQLITVLVSCGIGLGGAVFSVVLMSKKLNLP